MCHNRSWTSSNEHESAIFAERQSLAGTCQVIATNLTFEPDAAAVERSGLRSRLPEDYLYLLDRANGLYSHQYCLHILGIGVGVPAFHDIERWNDSAGWRQEYGDLVDNLVFFAETAFGDQFYFDAELRVGKLLAETGYRTIIAETFSEWVDRLEVHAPELLDLEVIEIWAGEQNRLAPGLHLCPQIPFCLGGAIDKPTDAYLGNSIEDMFFKGRLASQLKHVKPGEKVDLRAINLPP